MKHLITILTCLISINSVYSATKSIPSKYYKKTIFIDKFDSDSLKAKWYLHKSSSKIKDGLLIGIEKKGGGHAAIHFPLGLPNSSDMEVSTKVRFHGGEATDITFSDTNYKGSHAGHICRVSIRLNKILMQDGKDGIFNNKYWPKIKVGQADAKINKILQATRKTIPIRLKKDKWYTVSVRIKKNVMQLIINKKLIATLKSSGIAHKTKNFVGIEAAKEEMHFDYVEIKVPE